MGKISDKFRNMKMENKLLFLALICGLCAGASGYGFLVYKERALINSMKPVKVLVAARYINSKTKFGEDMVRFAEVPAAFVTTAHAKEFRQIKGKTALVPFIEGEPLLLNKVSDNPDALSSSVPTGLRAVAVAVDEESSAGYMIKPGDYVDALLTYESGGERKNGTVTATILQSIQVVAAGSGPEGEGSDKKYNTISLAVTAEEAELIVFAGARGRITFTLRPVGETGREKLKAATFEELIKQVKANEKSAPQSYAPAPGTNNNDADDVSKREE